MAPIAKQSNLRQRRSKSPLVSRGKGDPEAPLERGATTFTNGYGNEKVKGYLKLTFITQATLVIATISAVPVAYWLLLLSGIHNPDASCPIAKFEYPWCANTLMHVEKVAGPLTSEEWLDLRKKYQQALVKGGAAPSSSSLAEGWDEPGTVGFSIMESLEIRTSPGKGRGMYATQMIPKGTKIWDSRYRAVFPNECSAKHFFAGLSNQLACDAMFWGYTNNFYGNGLQYMFDLDGHGYINHDSKDPNAIHHFEEEMDQDRYAIARLLPWGGSLSNDPERWQARNRPGAYGLYALRDIQAGEEILYDYNEIFLMGVFDWYSILVSRSLPIRDWFTI